MSPFDSVSMATKYIIGTTVATFALAYVLDTTISDKKIFGGIDRMSSGLLIFLHDVCFTI